MYRLCKYTDCANVLIGQFVCTEQERRCPQIGEIGEYHTYSCKSKKNLGVLLDTVLSTPECRWMYDKFFYIGYTRQGENCNAVFSSIGVSMHINEKSE